MRLPATISSIFSTHSAVGAAPASQPCAADQAPAPTTMGAVQDSVGSFLKVLGGRNEVLRNRCENFLTLSQAVQPLTLEISAIFKEFDKLIAESQSASERLEDARTTLESQKTLIATQTSELEEVRGLYATAEEGRQRLVAAHQALTERTASLETDLSQTRDELSTKSASLRSREYEVEALRSESQNQQAELERLSSKLKDVDKLNADIVEERRNLSEKLAQISDEHHTLTLAHDEVSAQAVKYKREALETSAELDKVRSLSSALQQDLDGAKQELATLKEGAIVAADQYEKLKFSYDAKIEALNSRIRISDQLLNQSREEVRTLSAEQTQIYAQMRELEALPARVSSLTNDLGQAVRRAEDAERALEPVNRRSAELVTKVQASEERNKQAADRIASLQSTLLNFEQDVKAREQKLEEQIARMSEKLQREKAERTYVEGALEAARRDRSQLQQTLIMLKNSAHELTAASVQNIEALMSSELDGLKAELRDGEAEVIQLHEARR